MHICLDLLDKPGAICIASETILPGRPYVVELRTMVVDLSVLHMFRMMECDNIRIARTYEYESLVESSISLPWYAETTLRTE